MKKVLTIILSVMLLCVVACTKVEEKKDIELMGAGDRIHDTYTFANTGVQIEEKEENVYRIYGEVDKIQDEKVKAEFDIDEEVTHVIAIKLSANGRNVEKEKVIIKVDGVRAYDAEHLNGDDYTFVILEAVNGKKVSMTVSWDGKEELSYVISFDENLSLK